MRSIVKLDRIMWTLAVGAAMASAIASGDKNQQGNPKPPPPPPPQQRSEAPRQAFQPPQQQHSEAPRQAYQPRPQQRNDAPRQAFQPPARVAPRTVEPVQAPRNAPTQPRAFEPHQVPRNATPFSNPQGTIPAPRVTSLRNGSFRIGEATQANQSGQGQGRNSGYQGPGNPSQSNPGRGNQSGTARSGHADYHGSNNRYAQRDSQPHWNAPPVMSVSQFRAEQLRELHNAHTVYGDHARRGYVGYSREWRDSSFTYPFYVFDPYLSFGFVSPWYLYQSLPGYINPSRCTFLSAGLLPPMFLGLEYRWYQPANDAAYQQGYDQGYQDAQQATQQTDPPADNRILDGALDDIIATFKNDDQRALDRLVGETGNINIYVDGRYSYSLATNDFYDLIRDNATTTQTVDYQILDVKVNGGEAKVVALHTFKDPWGDVEKVYHTYTLKVGQRSAQIIEYGTSANPPA